MTRRFLVPVLFAASLCCAPPVLQAAPARWDRPTISGDVTWSGEIDLDDSVTVAPGGSLRILPGTRVRVAAGKGVAITAQGRFSIEGTAGEGAVVFLPEKPGGPLDQWEGIRFPGGGKEPGALAGFRLEGAREGVSVAEGAVSLRDAVFSRCGAGYRGNQKSRAVFDNCLFDGNGNGAFLSFGAEGVFRGSRFTNILGSGIAADKGAVLSVSGCLFERGKAGILSLTNAPCRVEGSAFSSLESGIVARQMGKESVVSRCAFGNNVTGVLAVQFCSLEVSDSTFRGNQTGIEVKEFSAPSVRHNRFEANQAAVSLSRKSHAVVERNAFFHNRNAVVVNYSSYPKIAANNFDRNDTSVALEKFQSGDWEERSGSGGISGGESSRRGSQFAGIAGQQGKFPRRVFARGNYWGPDPGRDREKGTMGKIRDGRSYGPVRYEGFGDGEYAIDVVDFSEELSAPVADAGPRKGGPSLPPEGKRRGVESLP